MYRIRKAFNADWYITFAILLLITLSTVVLRSVAPFLYPLYFVYLFLSVIFLFLFLRIDFEIFTTFSSILYIFSIVLLALPLIIGQVTRGAIRWIPIGSLTIQPSEIVRPFLLIFFAKYITDEINITRFLKALLLFLLPFFLILIQPSLGVSILTAIGFFGILLASNIKKKYIAGGLVFLTLLLPLLWFQLMPYQRQRLTVFLDPTLDRLGAGYHSIQAMISVGSGRLIGRGLGEGVQTQLAFLPEKHTDFIFAAISEELGFVGVSLVLMGLFLIGWRLIKIVENPKNPAARAYAAAVFLIFFAETFIHAGMNMGLMPVTGIPLPFVSAGGSALVGGIIALAIAMNAKK